MKVEKSWSTGTISFLEGTMQSWKRGTKNQVATVAKVCLQNADFESDLRPLLKLLRKDVKEKESGSERSVT